MTRLLGSLSGLGGGGGVAPADLTGPAAPAPVSLASGTTALGSTSIGSWSAAVTVTAACEGSDSSTPTVTVTGSGAGPYSVSIASGLADGVTYAVELTGTGADGQVAVVSLSVAVREPATITGSLQWEVVSDWDFTLVDTAAAFTTSGALALTTGGGTPFLTITTYTPSGSGTGSITPTNGVGLQIATTSSFQRAFYFQPSMTGITQGRQRWAVEWIHTLSSLATGGLVLPSVGSTASINSGKQFGQGAVRDGATAYNMRVRNRDGAATISGGNVVSSTTLFAAYRAVQILSPGGGQAFMHASSTPTGPESAGTEQFSALENNAAATPILQNPYIHVSYGVAAVTATLTRIRLWREVVA